MNAIEILLTDHRHIKQLLKQLTNTPQGDHAARSGLVERIEADLRMHTRMEEDVFYPEFERATQGKHEAMRFEAVEEHRVAEKSIADLRLADTASDVFDGRAKVLKELIEHHVQEEERDMFPLMRDMMNETQLNELGHRMNALRVDLMAGTAEPQGTMAGMEKSAAAAIGKLEERAQAMISEAVEHPTQMMGKGVEAVVRSGATLAREVIGGARRGLDDASRSKREPETHDYRER